MIQNLFAKFIENWQKWGGGKMHKNAKKQTHFTVFAPKFFQILIFFTKFFKINEFH